MLFDRVAYRILSKNNDGATLQKCEGYSDDRANGGYDDGLLHA